MRTILNCVHGLTSSELTDINHYKSECTWVDTNKKERLNNHYYY